MVDAAVMHPMRTLSKKNKDIVLNPRALTSLKDVHSLHIHIGFVYELVAAVCPWYPCLSVALAK
jgi:hypothetical protein